MRCRSEKGLVSAIDDDANLHDIENWSCQSRWMEGLRNMSTHARDLLGQVGVGVDIESIDRFRDRDVLRPSVLNKIFTRRELDYCLSKESSAPHLAARFSGKEAVIKAIGSLSNLRLFYNEIEILNNDIGVPIVRLSRDELAKLEVKLSLSHSEDKVLAFALAAEKQQ